MEEKWGATTLDSTLSRYTVDTLVFDMEVCLQLGIINLIPILSAQVECYSDGLRKQTQNPSMESLRLTEGRS